MARRQGHFSAFPELPEPDAMSQASKGRVDPAKAQLSANLIPTTLSTTTKLELKRLIHEYPMLTAASKY